MNVNVRISLTDEQRNVLYQKITGKKVKAMITRAGVVALVNDFIDSMLTDQAVSHPEQKPMALTMPDAHDDCCKQNQLLLRRVNTLQHRLDTNAK